MTSENLVRLDQAHDHPRKSQFEYKYITDELIKKIRDQNGYQQFQSRSITAAVNDMARAMATNIKQILVLYPDHLFSTFKAYCRIFGEVDEKFKDFQKHIKTYFIDCEERHPALLKQLEEYADDGDTPLKKLRKSLLKYADEITLWDSNEKTKSQQELLLDLHCEYTTAEEELEKEKKLKKL